MTKVQALQHRVAELEMALRPFAQEDLCLFHYGFPFDAIVVEFGDARLKLYHFRRARAVMAGRM